MHMKKQKGVLDVLQQTFGFCSFMLYKLWSRTQRVWENIVFIWLVNANDLYLKQHPSVGGLFPLLSVEFLSIMQCYPGRGSEREEKQTKNLQAQFQLSIKQKVSTQTFEHKEACRFMNRGLKFDYFLLQSKQLSFK